MLVPPDAKKRVSTRSADTSTPTSDSSVSSSSSSSLSRRSSASSASNKKCPRHSHKERGRDSRSASPSRKRKRSQGRKEDQAAPKERQEGPTRPTRSPLPYDKARLVLQWMGTESGTPAANVDSFRAGLERLLKKEFALRASQRSVGILTEVLKERCTSSANVDALLAVVEQRMKEDAKDSSRRLTTPWYVLDVALKLFRRTELFPILICRLPAIISDRLPFRDGGRVSVSASSPSREGPCPSPRAEGERERFAQLFATWRTLVPPETLSLIESMLGRVPCAVGTPATAKCPPLL